MDLSDVNPKVLVMVGGGLALSVFAMTLGGGKETLQEQRQVGQEIQEQRRADAANAARLNASNQNLDRMAAIAQRRFERGVVFVFDPSMQSTTGILEGYPVAQHTASGPSPLEAGNVVGDINGCTAEMLRVEGNPVAVATNVACTSPTDPVVLQTYASYMQARGMTPDDRIMSGAAGGGPQPGENPFRQSQQPQSQQQQFNQPIDFNPPAQPQEFEQPAPSVRSPVSSPNGSEPFRAPQPIPMERADSNTDSIESGPARLQEWADSQNADIPDEFKPQPSSAGNSTTDGNLSGG